MKRSNLTFVLCMGAAISWSDGLARAAPMSTGFAYQGQIKKAGAPLTDTADFEFSLWDTATNGTQVGATVSTSGVSVVDGLFTIELDFGAGVFAGDACWLEIAVRSPAGLGTLTTLGPRHELKPAPYALHAASAGAVTDGITGNGIARRIARFTGNNTIGDSSVYESNSGGIGVCGAPYWQFGWGPDFHVNTGADTARVWIGQDLSSNGAQIGSVEFVGRHAGMMNPSSFAGISGQIIDKGHNAKGALLMHTRAPISSLPNSGYAERMRIMHSGNVGIGTQSPAEKLEVDGAIKVGATTNTNAGAIQWTGTDFMGYDGTSWISLTNLGGDGDWNVAGPDMYAAVPGHIGIGASNFAPPDEMLTLEGVAADGNVPKLQIKAYSTELGGTATLRLGKSGSTILGFDQPTSAGHQLGLIDVFGCNTSRVFQMASRIAFVQSEHLDPANPGPRVPAEIRFATSDGQTQSTNRMVIDKTGNVGIGELEPAARLDVAGNIRFTGDLIGYVDADRADFADEADVAVFAETIGGKYVDSVNVRYWRTNDHIVDMDYLKIYTTGGDGELVIEVLPTGYQMAYGYSADNGPSTTGFVNPGASVVLSGLSSGFVDIRVFNTGPGVTYATTLMGLAQSGQLRGHVIYRS